MTENESENTRHDWRGQKSEKRGHSYETTRWVRKMAAVCMTRSQTSHLARHPAIHRIVTELLHCWETAYREGKRQTVLEDAHGDGEAGMGNM